MISNQFVSVYPRVCAIQFPPYRTQPLTQIDHKVLLWKGESKLSRNRNTYLTHVDPHTLLWTPQSTMFCKNFCLKH